VPSKPLKLRPYGAIQICLLLLLLVLLLLLNSSRTDLGLGRRARFHVGRGASDLGAATAAAATAAAAAAGVGVAEVGESRVSRAASRRRRPPARRPGRAVGPAYVCVCVSLVIRLSTTPSKRHPPHCLSTAKLVHLISVRRLPTEIGGI